VVHTSTSEVYGTARYVPIDEAHPLQAQSPYSASKIGADMLAQAFHAAFALPVVTVRPFNTYGPRQSARAIVPAIATQCLSGGTVRLGNLTPTRDLTFVADTVDGFVRAGESARAVGRTVNLGTGMEIAVGALVTKIATLLGRAVTVEQESARVRPAGSEVERLCADTGVAREVLDWRAAHTLDDGLRPTLEWIEGHLDRYRPGAYAI
jgi:dTDP-glucose 4,6-dehydratase